MPLEEPLARPHTAEESIEGVSLHGLTSAEAQAAQAQYGRNEVPPARQGAVRALLRKFWAPVPWMLEVTIVLQLALGKVAEAIVITVLLVVNALVSFVQEHRANQALALLQHRLAVQARVRRDGRWQRVPAQELVPGDVVHVRMGDLAPADIRVLDGQLLLDQAALTGESLPVEAGVGATAYAGTTVTRGEATGVVTATGQHTVFGKTAELVRSAKTVSHLETVILTIVTYLVVLDTGLVLALLVYALVTAMPLAEVLPFALILLVASVPVALPATFTLATALGALELARHGVLVTRLAAIEEAAAMDVLASDKTGTLTQNRLALAAVCAYAPSTEDEVLRLAALACDDATQDPFDLAILSAARTRRPLDSLPQRLRFVPFDPATRRSEAVFVQDGPPLRVLKGAPQAIAALVQGAPELSADIDRLAANGSRLLAVAVGTDNALRLAGLVALEDPPRDDARTLVQNLHDVGVRVVMVTGDSLATARTVAAQVGVGDRACPPEALHGDIEPHVEAYDVFARVFPEDKFHLVQALQRAG